MRGASKNVTRPGSIVGRFCETPNARRLTQTPYSSFAALGGGLYNRAMLDIRLIREKPDFVRARLATRGGGDEAQIDEVLRVDAERRKTETELQRLQSERNRLSKEIGAKKSRGESTDDLQTQVRKIGEEIVDLEQRAASFDEQQRNLLL